MKKMFLLFVLLPICQIVVAQSSDVPVGVKMQNLQINHPVSAQLLKYQSYPVSLATGTAEVSIPLFEANYYGLKIPFSLSYHSSGIKVEESAGILGYGWSLTPNLRVVRQLNGKEDELFLLKRTALYRKLMGNGLKLVVNLRMRQA
jgi:hypothetical protein